MAQREFRQIYPQPGWVEHDPEEIWQTQLATAREALAKAGITAATGRAIGITNQRETTVVWNRRTGQPVHHAIVWQDRRGEPLCAQLREQGHAEAIRRKHRPGGRRLFLGTKLRWILDHVPGAHIAAARGELAFGTMDSWLLWKLTGGRRACHRREQCRAHHAVRHPPQRGTTSCWPCCTCPPSAAARGAPQQPCLRRDRCRACWARPIPDRRHGGRPAERAVRPGLLLAPGMAKNTYGTGCFMLMHTGDPVPTSQQRPDHHRAAQPGRHARVCAGGQRVHRRRRGAVAARRPARHPAAARCRRWPKACPTAAA
jgi:glycerol kinase